jgi:hypothetical protein
VGLLAAVAGGAIAASDLIGDEVGGDREACASHRRALLACTSLFYSDRSSGFGIRWRTFRSKSGATADRFKNVASGYSGNVHLTTVDPGAGVTLPADNTFIASDNGVHIFVNVVTLATSGDQVVAATDTLSGSITGISQPIAVQRPISRSRLGRSSHRRRRPNEADRASRASRNAWKGRRDTHLHPTCLMPGTGRELG